MKMQRFAFAGTEQIAGDVLNPTVGAELDRTDQGMGDEENKKKKGTNGEFRHHPNDDHEHAGHDPRHHI